MAGYKLKGRIFSLQEIRRIVERSQRDFAAFRDDLVACVYENTLRDGDVTVDGGAAHGWHTFAMAKLVGGRGRVHAVEPLPDHCEFLRARAEQWRYEARIVLHEVALGADNGSTPFHRVVEDSGLSGVRRPWAPAGTGIEVVEVALRRLEDIVPVEDWPRLSFVKLDLQGAECAALRHGAEKLVTAARPIIAFKSGGSAAALYDYSADEVFRFFERLNYDLFDIFGSPFTRDAFTSKIADAPFELVAIPHEKRRLELPVTLHRRLEQNLRV